MTLSLGKMSSKTCLDNWEQGIFARSIHRSAKVVDCRGPPLSCSWRGRFQSISVADLIVLYLPLSVTLSSGTAADALVDIDVTSGGVGMCDAGGPFGLGVPCLDISTAEGDAMDVLAGGNCSNGKALCRTCLFGGPPLEHAWEVLQLEDEVDDLESWE